MFSLSRLRTLALPVFLSVLAVSASAVRFTPISSYPSGGVAQYVVAADVNGDGKVDVIASNSNGKVTVLLGTGHGSFLPPNLIATIAGGAPSIAVADFNHDGKPDLAVVSSPGDNVQIYLGHGDGTFAVPLTVSTGAKPTRVVIGDVNNDGHPDLLIGITGGFNVLLGNGNGTFRPATKVTGQNSIDVALLAVGDINQDGRLDVITSDGQSTEQVFLGKGDGTFQERDNSINVLSPSQLLLADLNGDSKLDLVVGSLGFENNPSAAIVVLWGNGDGTFQTNATAPTVGFDSASVVAVDLNGDGKLDLAVANVASNSVSVLLNKGDRQFAPAVNYSTRFLPSDLFSPLPGLLTSGDFNGDGRPDLALGNADGVEPLMNLGGGQLYAPTSIELLDDPVSAAAVDLNGDGHQDIAVETRGDLYLHALGSISALFGNGSGQFTQVLVDHTGDLLGAPVAVADFNHDGKLDLSIPGFFGPSVHIYFNIGHNAFSRPTDFGLPGNQITVIAAGDFNNDGKADLAALDGNQVDVFLGKGDGSFSGPTVYFVGKNPNSILVSDLNRDGKRDLVVTNNGSGDVSVLLGKGDGSFEAAKTFSAGVHPSSVAVGDFNRDGKLDLAVGGDTMEILLGRGDGEFGSAVSYPAGGPVTFVAQADLRRHDIADLLVTHGSLFQTGRQNITVLYGKGDGSFGTPTSYAAGVDPIWLAVGDFNEDGAIDIAVVDNGSTALTLLLNHGGTRITLKSSATAAKAGQRITFTATLNPSVAGSGTPAGTIAFKDGAKGFAFVHVQNGQAVFTTSHLSPGTHTITASYWGDGNFNPHISTAVTETIQP